VPVRARLATGSEVGSLRLRGDIGAGVVAKEAVELLVACLPLATSTPATGACGAGVLTGAAAAGVEFDELVGVVAEAALAFFTFLVGLVGGFVVVVVAAAAAAAAAAAMALGIVFLHQDEEAVSEWNSVSSHTGEGTRTRLAEE